MSRIRRILHPSDFSRASGAAFSQAVEQLAKTNNAELLVVHVLAPILPMLGDGHVSPKVYEDLVASARGHGKKNLDALVAKAKKAGVRATSVLLEGVAHARDRADGAQAAGRPRGRGHARAHRAREALSRQRGRTPRRHRFVPGDDRAREVATSP